MFDPFELFVLLCFIIKISLSTNFFLKQHAGILLDAQSLNIAAKFFTNRDVEAVQLLLLGSTPNYMYELFEQCSLLF